MPGKTVNPYEHTLDTSYNTQTPEDLRRANRETVVNMLRYCNARYLRRWRAARKLKTKAVEFLSPLRRSADGDLASNGDTAIAANGFVQVGEQRNPAQVDDDPGHQRRVLRRDDEGPDVENVSRREDMGRGDFQHEPASADAGGL